MEFEAVVKRQFIFMGKQFVAKTLPPLRTFDHVRMLNIKLGGKGVPNLKHLEEIWPGVNTNKQNPTIIFFENFYTKYQH